MLADSNAGITRFELYIDGHKKFLSNSRFKAHISFFLLGRSHAYVRSVKQTGQGVETKTGMSKLILGRGHNNVTSVEQGFKGVFTFNIHEQTHTGEKQYQCKGSV